MTTATVLIIDDEPQIRSAMSNMLAIESRILEAVTGQQGRLETGPSVAHWWGA